MDDIRDILAQVRKALELSSMSLDSINSYDDEDRSIGGESQANKICIRINKRAVAKIDAFLAANPHEGG